MNMSSYFFYFFSIVLIYASLRVITAHNPVVAVLHLMLAFSQASALWLLLRAEFLAIVLVLVYLGAVMVLFLFVVMMLDIKIERQRKALWRQHMPLATVIGLVIFIEMAFVVFYAFGAIGDSYELIGLASNNDYSNTRELGKILYTEYLYPIEIAAVILLVAMIAAIALTLRHRTDNKAIAPQKQIQVWAHERMHLISMPSVKKCDVNLTDTKEEGQ